MSGTEPAARTPDIRDARRLFPATADRAYFNTAATGLASQRLADSYHAFIDEWTAGGLDFPRGEQAAGEARSAVARLTGADARDIALIPSVSSAAGLVAAQFGPAGPGESIVIGQREYSSNHFPWRQLAGKGYDVRQVPFRNGGLEPEDVAERVDAGTRVVAFSGVQSATGHRSDIADAAGAHQADLATQAPYGVNYLRYWLDEEAGKIFCLVDAPDAEAANTVHRQAHGLVADEIYPVSEHA